MTFEEWLASVDRFFVKLTGLDRDSWPDQDYYTWFEEEIDPAEAVALAIENEYGEYGLKSFGLEIE